MNPILAVVLVSVGVAGLGALALVRRPGDKLSGSSQGGKTATTPPADSSMPAPTMTVRAEPTVRRTRRVAVIGDSIGAARGGFVSQLAEALSRRGVELDNHAVSGYTTSRMLGVAQRELTPGRYDTLVVEGHLNDHRWPASRSIGNLRRIYQLARDRGVRRIIAVGSTPWKGYRNWTPAHGLQRVEVERWLESGADGLIDRYVGVYLDLEDPARPHYLAPRFNSGDNLHPNRAGQRVLFEAVAPALGL